MASVWINSREPLKKKEMQMNKLLDGICIIDFSHRLPGPLGMNILGDLGAKVIKLEDSIFKDAFCDGSFSEFDDSFVDWYENLNNNKTIIRLPFKEKDSIKKIHTYIRESDGILMTLPNKVREFLELTDEKLKEISPQLAVIEMGSSTIHNQAMHDLNAMALTGMLSLYVQDKESDILAPPFLPISGILFGQQLATQLLAAIIQSRTNKSFVKTTAYLFDTAQQTCSPLWSQKMRESKRVKFLHNGAYPCYSLYRTKDNHYLGVAAVEEKFWLEFVKEFQIELPASERFKTSSDCFMLVANRIKNLTLKEAKNKIEGKNICVSAIEKIN